MSQDGSPPGVSSAETEGPTVPPGSRVGSPAAEPDPGQVPAEAAEAAEPPSPDQAEAQDGPEAAIARQVALAADEAERIEASLSDDPNLAVVAAFLTKFGLQCGVDSAFSLSALQGHLESRAEVAADWVQLHVKLLRKIHKSVSPAKWEKALIKFVYLVSTEDAWELEKLSYRLLASPAKLRILKALLESQFDLNIKFKSQVNKCPAEALRAQPLGWDCRGHAYWLQMDETAEVRVYQDDPDEETWTLVARTRDELASLIGRLRSGGAAGELAGGLEAAEALEDEDSQDYANILRDTGPAPESGQTSHVPSAENSGDDEPALVAQREAMAADPIPVPPQAGLTGAAAAKPPASTSPVSTARSPLGDDVSAVPAVQPLAPVPLVSHSEAAQAGPQKSGSPPAHRNGPPAQRPINPRPGTRVLASPAKAVSSPIQTLSEPPEAGTRSRPAAELLPPIQTSSPDANQSAIAAPAQPPVGALAAQAPTPPQTSSADPPAEARTLIAPQPEPLASNAQAPLDTPRLDPKSSVSTAQEPARISPPRPDKPSPKSESPTRKEPWAKSPIPDDQSVPKSLIATVQEPLAMSPKLQDQPSSTAGGSIRKEPLAISPKLQDQPSSTAEGSIRKEPLAVSPIADDKSVPKSSVATSPKLQDKPSPKSAVSTPKEPLAVSRKSDDQPLPKESGHNDPQSVAMPPIAPHPEPPTSEAKVSPEQSSHEEPKPATISQAEIQPESQTSEAKAPPPISNQEPKVVVSPKAEEESQSKSPDSEVKTAPKISNQESKCEVSLKAKPLSEPSVSEAKSPLKPTIKDPKADGLPLEKPLAQSSASGGKSTLPPPKESKSDVSPKEAPRLESLLSQAKLPRKHSNTDPKPAQTIPYKEVTAASDVKPHSTDLSVALKPSETIPKETTSATIFPLATPPRADPQPSRVANGGPVLFSPDVKTPPKKSHYSIESLISKDNDPPHRHKFEPPVVTGEKRPIESPGSEDSANSEKKAKLSLPTQDAPITDPARLVVGRGNGAENQSGPSSPDFGDVIEEPVRLFSGRGSGAANLARNPEPEADSQTTGNNGVEAKSMKSEVKGAVKDEPPGEGDPKSNGKDRIAGNADDTKPKIEPNEEDEEDKFCKPKSREKRQSKKSKRDQEDEDEGEDDHSPMLRSSRRTSSRIATLRMKEAEKRQREEELALEDYRDKMRKKDVREQRRMEKYRALGREFERELQKRGQKKKATGWDGTDDDYEEDDEDDEVSTKKRKRKKKKKKKRGEENLKEFARFSSGSSDDDEGLEGEDMEELEHEDEDEEDDLFQSDHEFSCESDVPDHEAQPIQHARTATKTKRTKKKPKKSKPVQETEAVEDEEEEEEDEEDDEADNWACKKCNKKDHPEWILLCDKCDDGWHGSCLRPSLMVIPEGSWFCPNCQHADLLGKLEENLLNLEVLLKKKDADTKRKERLAFVSLSLSNMIPANAKVKSEKKRKPPRRRDQSDQSDSASSDEDFKGSSSSHPSSAEEEEPMPDGRRRATRNISYSLKAYDDMIRSAIADEVDYDKGAGMSGKGKDMENVTGRAEEEEDEEGEEDEEQGRAGEISKSSTGQSGLGRGKDMANILGQDDEDEEDVGDSMDPAAPQPMVMEIQKDTQAPGKGKKGTKKGKKKLSTLSSSEDNDGDSGSDFVASEISVEEDEDDFLDDAPSDNDSDELGKRKSRGGLARRKSGRSRKVMYDEDFVFDGSESEDDKRPKRKARRAKDDSWDSEVTDDEEDYAKSKKKKASSSSSKQKKRPKRKYDSLSSEEEDEDFEMKMSKKKQKILSDDSAQRRTRGKKIAFDHEDSDESDDDVPLQRVAVAKKKTAKKKLDDTDTEMEDYQSEPELDDDEEEDSDD